MKPVPRNPFVRDDATNPNAAIPFRALELDPGSPEEAEVEELRDPIRRALLLLLTPPRQPHDLRSLAGEVEEARRILRGEILRGADLPAPGLDGLAVLLRDAFPEPPEPRPAPPPLPTPEELVSGLLIGTGGSPSAGLPENAPPSRAPGPGAAPRDPVSTRT